VADVAVFAQPARSVVIQVIVRPVRFLVYIPGLVVELRVEQYQPRQFGGSPGRVVRSEAATEAGPEQADPRCSSRLTEMSQRNPDVIEVRGQHALFLSAFALPVAAEVVAQAGDPGLAQPIGQPCEESAFLTSNPAAVD